MPTNDPGTAPGLKNPRTTIDAIKAYLSYQDTVPEGKREDEFQGTLNLPSAHTYARALLDLFSSHGEKAVIERARLIVSECGEVLAALGMEPSCWGRSISFAAWDMAKQHYFYTHQTQATEKYPPRDPMTDETLRAEIVNRHVGWEVYSAFSAGSFTHEDIEHRVPPRSRTQVVELLQTPPKPENNSLSSWQLSLLGAFLRSDQTPSSF